MRLETDQTGKLIWAALLLFIAPFIVYFVPQYLGFNAYIVESNSMKPVMSQGDVLYETDVNSQNLEVGDVILFEPNGSRMSEETVAHRIVEIREGNYTLQFKTMGDANAEPDPGWTPSYEVVGKRAFSIPYLGAIITTFTSLPVVLLLVAIPSTILIRNQLIKLMEKTEMGESQERSVGVYRHGREINRNRD